MVGEPDVISGDGLVEIGGRIGAVGGDHSGVVFRRLGDLAGARGGHEIGADVFPVVARDAGVRRRNHVRQGVLRDGLIIANEADEVVEGVLVKLLAGVAGVHGRDRAGRDASLMRGQLRLEIVRCRRLEADFEPLIEI